MIINLIGNNNLIPIFLMDALQSKKSNQSKLKTSKVTLKQSLMGACTNIIYRLGVIGGIKRMPKLLKGSASSNQCCIFGENISDQMIAKQRLAKIIWFTYRQNLVIAEDINSDVGWGCMPRVGQMVLAQALYRHFSYKNQVMDQKQILKIIEPFLDDSQECSGYSLSTILKHARRRFGLLPGQWFNIGKLSEVLRKIQQEQPLKGSQNLKVVFFSQSVIFISAIEEASKIQNCRCLNKKYFCLSCNKSQQIKQQQKMAMNKKQSSGEIIMTIQELDEDLNAVQELKPAQQLKEIYDSNWEIYDDKNQKQWIDPKNKKQEGLQIKDSISKTKSTNEEHLLLNSLLLIVSIRTSEKTIQKFDVHPIINLLSLPTSIGIIGGVPSKALYIVGSQGDDLIYLDPHYVQEHVGKQNFVENLNTFFCSDYRTLNIEALDPSMALCFYLRTFEDVRNLLVSIQQLKQHYQKDGRSFFISVMDKDNFQDDELQERRNNSGDSSGSGNQASFQYSSLEFRDISDSY